MALSDKDEFEGMLNLIKNIQETVEGRFSKIDTEVRAAGELTEEGAEKALQDLNTLQREYEVDDAVVLANLKQNFCDLQPTYSFFTPWWWSDLRDDEEAQGVLNNMFRLWLSVPDRNLLSEALIELRNLGHQMQSYKVKLEQDRNALKHEPVSIGSFSFLTFLGLQNTEAQVDEAEQRKREEGEHLEV